MKDYNVTLFCDVDMSKHKNIKDYIKEYKSIQKDLFDDYCKEEDTKVKEALHLMYNLVDMGLRQAKLCNDAFNKMNHSITESEYRAYEGEYEEMKKTFASEKNILYKYSHPECLV